MRRVPPLSTVDLTSLDERLGVLLVLRAGLVSAVLVIAATVPAQLAGRPHPVLVSSFAYLAAVGLGEAAARLRPDIRVSLHRLLLPLDVLWLGWVLVPAGGAIRATVLLLAVEVVAVTLLASLRSGLRVVLWITAVLLAARVPWLADRLAAVRPSSPAHAATADTVLALAGLWAIVICVGWFSAVNERELRRAKQELAALTAMAAELETLHANGDILQGLLASLDDAFDLDRAVAVWDDGEEVLVRRALRPRDHPAGPLPDPVLEPGWDDELARQVWGTRAPALATGATDAGVVAALLPGARRIVTLPLGPDGTHRGIVAVAPRGGLLSRRTVAALSQFSSHATLVLRNARLLAERERLARLDGLTGLANRRALDATLTAEVERARRSEEPLSVVVVDLDHFKLINDVQGHQAGDEVLRTVARLLAGSVRASDTAARYGGEEFALVLPSCGVEGALRVAEAARSAVAGHPDLGGLTLSAGVATLDTWAPDAAGLVRAADAALYRSKRSGRDRVSVACPEDLDAVADPAPEDALDLRERPTGPAPRPPG